MRATTFANVYSAAMGIFTCAVLLAALALARTSYAPSDAEPIASEVETEVSFKVRESASDHVERPLVEGSRSGRAGADHERLPDRAACIATEALVVGLVSTPKWRPSWTRRVGRVETIVMVICAASAEAEVPADVLAAIGARESGFRQGARGRAGEVGAWQVGRATAARYCRKAGLRAPALDIAGSLADNARCAARVLAAKMRECGTIERAVGAYNTGRCDRGAHYADAVLRQCAPRE